MPALQEAGKVRQRRSRIVQTFNVPEWLRLRSSLAAALSGARCSSGRQGWVGENGGFLPTLCNMKPAAAIR